ncbi:MAG: DNA methyltransferase [Stellaceae bacterium]
MALFNPKTLEAALQTFDFAPGEALQNAASHWAGLMRNGFLLSRKETALESDFKQYVVQGVLGYRSFDTSGTATVSQLLDGKARDLLERSLHEDKDITNKLYQEYRGVRENLLHFIRNQHAEIPAEDAIALAQKILDRVIFIAFAEDTVLLPDDSIRSAVDFTDPYGDPKPKWEYLKRLFDAVDHGNPRLKIPPYNGGLFATDPRLDALAIPDHLIDQFGAIATYDFGSQVSVTILGHIFEQSITDIEQKHAEVRREAPPRTSKRKREGVVYTPDFVTRFIVEHTIGEHLRERFEALLAEHSDGEDATGAVRWRGKGAELSFWRAYLECVTGLRILDPACGSGAFLIAAFDFLKAEQTRVRERLSELEPALLVHWSADTDIEIITRNLYGVDVNSESVEITKLSLWLKTAKRGRQLESSMRRSAGATA